MPNTNKIQVSLAGAFMPDYYSSLATHFLNIWVEYETTGPYNALQKLGSTSKSKFEDLHRRVCFLIILIISLCYPFVNYIT